MEKDWKPFENLTLPPSGVYVLVYTPDASPHIQIAKWSGQGRDFLIKPFDRSEGMLFERVTHWMELPGAPVN
jgi:hypothetical protein